MFETYSYGELPYLKVNEKVRIATYVAMSLLILFYNVNGIDVLLLVSS